MSMTRIFRLKDIDSFENATEIIKRINEIKYIKDCGFNFFTEKLSIEADNKDFEKIIPKVKKICKEVDPYIIFVDCSK